MLLFFSYFVLFSNSRLLDEFSSITKELKTQSSQLDIEDPSLLGYQDKINKLSEQVATIRNDTNDIPVNYHVDLTDDFNYSSDYQSLQLFEWTSDGKKKSSSFLRAVKPSLQYAIFKIFPTKETNSGDGWKYSGSKGNFTFAFEESYRPLFAKYRQIDSVIIKNEIPLNCSIKSFYLYTFNIEGNDQFGPFNLTQGICEFPINSNKRSKAIRIIVNENNGDAETCLENGVYAKQ